MSIESDIKPAGTNLVLSFIDAVTYFPSSGPSGHLLPGGEGPVGRLVPLPLGPLGEGAAKRRVRAAMRERIYEMVHLGSGVGVSKPQRLYGDNLVDLPQKKTEPVDFSILAIL